MDYYDIAKEGEAFKKVRNHGKMKLLSAPLSLMKYREKLGFAKQEILKSYWRRGEAEKKTCVVMKHFFMKTGWKNSGSGRM